jgi:hypothetical protein
MEKKNIYREYYRGYGGHIPYKLWVFGMTVDATNNYIKSLLTKEPDYSSTFIPSIKNDYTYYKKDYFNEGVSKQYELEEDKIFGMRSKEARTWINGNKHVLYPEHIPGYTGHVSGIEPAGKKGSPIFGTSYAKATSIAIKGDYNKEIDLPPQERYLSIQKYSYPIPKMRSKEDMASLQNKMNLEEEQKRAIEYFDKLNGKGLYKNNYGNDNKDDDEEKGMSDAFKKAIHDKKPTAGLPYIVGYKGFRRGVVSENYYGKNFREISLTSESRIPRK